jgi:hypothetical protein
VVRGFTSRSQALSFEWFVKRMPRGRGADASDRRCHQLAAALRNPRWYTNHPPRPAALRLAWMPTFPGLSATELSGLPFLVTQTALPVDAAAPKKKAGC